MENVSFGYTDNRLILDGVDLVLDEPGLVCIIGPNGVGKSTLIKCMNKLLTPTSGDVYIDGVNVRDMTQKDVADVLGISQSYISRLEKKIIARLKSEIGKLV